MAYTTLKHGFLLLVAALSIAQLANAGDPDILSDFVLPGNVTTFDGKFFTFTGLRKLIGAEDPAKFTVTKVSMAEFPVLNGQSVSYAVLQYPAGTVNPPHTHPRSAEFLFLIDGTLEVGIVDTTNKLYTQTLQSGDLFVFPKGLVHYQYNTNSRTWRLHSLHLVVLTPEPCQFLLVCSPPELMMAFWHSLSRPTWPPFRRSKLVLHLKS